MKAIAGSMARFGQQRPILALPDGTIVAGNHTYRAAVDEAGWTHIAVVRSDLTDQEVEAYLLADNRHSDLGTYDDDVLLQLLRPFHETDALLGTWYTRDVVQDLIARDQWAAAQESRDHDSPPPEPDGDPRSEPGAVYDLGPHRLICGDATDPDVAVRLMGDEHGALVFTSPPYADLRDYRGEIDLSPAHLAGFISAFAEHAPTFAVNLGIVIRDHEIVEYWNDYIARARAEGLKLLAWNVWNRDIQTNLAAATSLTFPTYHEWIMVFGEKQKQSRRVQPTKTAGQPGGYRQRQKDGSVKQQPVHPVKSHKPLGSVLTLAPMGGAKGHVAPFPKQLPAAYIVALTDENDIVIDPFAGAGTTILAAHDTGRRCFAVEIDPGYCDLIRQRYADYVGDQSYAP